MGNLEWSPDRAGALLDKIRYSRVAVMGDFALDAYWFIEEAARDVSVETGRPIHAVRRQRYGLGGAGNVAANLAALGAGEVRAFGVVGDEPFGREMLHMMSRLGIETSGMIVQKEDWQTLLYGKPYRGEAEQDRIDFGSFNRLQARTVERLLERFDETLSRFSTVICNQQLSTGLLNEEMAKRIAKRIRRLPGHRFIVDSRHFGRLFDGAILKLNYKEARGFLMRREEAPDAIDLDDALQLARGIHETTGSPVYVTCSRWGLVVWDGARGAAVPGIPIEGPVDEVGAGDTACSAIAASLDAGASFVEACTLANTAAAVTVAKIFETGTATPEEILALMRKSCRI